MRKLGFLKRVTESEVGSLGARAMEALCDDAESICLVKECRELEEAFGTHYSDTIMRRGGSTVREMKEEFCRQDGQKLVDRCREKAPLIVEVAGRIGWVKLWDVALDLGAKAGKGLQMLSRIMSHHGRGSQPCQLCDTADFDFDFDVAMCGRSHDQLYRLYCRSRRSFWISSSYRHFVKHGDGIWRRRSGRNKPTKSRFVLRDSESKQIGFFLSPPVCSPSNLFRAGMEEESGKETG